MGGWKLEVAKMAMYLAFPISLFYYFNRPELFEKYIIEARREVFLPESETNDKEIKAFIKQMQLKQQVEKLKAIEQAEKK